MTFFRRGNSFPYGHRFPIKKSKFKDNPEKILLDLLTIIKNSEGNKEEIREGFKEYFEYKTFDSAQNLLDFIRSLSLFNQHEFYLTEVGENILITYNIKSSLENLDWQFILLKHLMGYNWFIFLLKTFMDLKKQDKNLDNKKVFLKYIGNELTKNGFYTFREDGKMNNHPNNHRVDGVFSLFEMFGLASFSNNKVDVKYSKFIQFEDFLNENYFKEFSIIELIIKSVLNKVYAKDKDSQKLINETYETITTRILKIINEVKISKICYLDDLINEYKTQYEVTDEEEILKNLSILNSESRILLNPGRVEEGTGHKAYEINHFIYTTLQLLG